MKIKFKYIIFVLILMVLMVFPLPYYIDAPGGIVDISNKIDIKGYKSNGSFNIAYVKEYKATIPMLTLSLINKDWDIVKIEDVLLEDEDINNYDTRDKILMKESISNAIYVAYSEANKQIKVKSNSIYVTYISSEARTNLNTGDIILKINNKSIKSKEDIVNIINYSHVNDKLNIEVNSNGKRINKYAYVDSENSKKIIGMLLSSVNTYETNPKVNVKIDKNESGPSGGLITALSIYNSLKKEDITNNYKIVGTGTIDMDGNVGSIGGIEYKLKSAVKNNADIFIVPNGDNYNEALKIKENNNYKIKIVGVSTFKEAIKYLRNI